MCNELFINAQVLMIQLVALLLASQFAGSDAGGYSDHSLFSKEVVDGIKSARSKKLKEDNQTMELEVGSNGVLPGTVQISRKRSARSEEIRRHRHGREMTKDVDSTGYMAADDDAGAQCMFNQTCSAFRAGSTECQHPYVRTMCPSTCQITGCEDEAPGWCSSVGGGGTSVAKYEALGWFPACTPPSTFDGNPNRAQSGCSSDGCGPAGAANSYTTANGTCIDCQPRVLGTNLGEWARIGLYFTDDGLNTTDSVTGDQPDPSSTVYDKICYVEIARFCAKTCNDGANDEDGHMVNTARSGVCSSSAR